MPSKKDSNVTLIIDDPIAPHRCGRQISDEAFNFLVNEPLVTYTNASFFEVWGNYNVPREGREEFNKYVIHNITITGRLSV